MITSTEIEILALQASKKRLPTNEYLIDVNNENFKYIKSKFFNGYTNDQVKLLNNGSGLFGTITKTISSFVGTPIMDFEFPIDSLVGDYLTFGFAVYGIEKIDNEYKIVYQPADRYINRNGVDYIIRSYQDINLDEVKYYYLETEHLNGIIKNRLYTTDAGFTSSVEVPLETIYETSNLSPLINTGLPKAMFVIKEDPLQQFPISEIDRVINNIYAIDRQVVMIDNQLIDNTENFILMKGIKPSRKLLTDYEEGKKINFSQLGRVVMGEADSSIEFIKNKNEMLVDAKSYIYDQISRISAITNIPLDFLGEVDKVGNIGEGSRTLLHNAFTKKIIKIRNLFDKYIIDTLEMLKYDEGYTWPDVFSKTTKELLDENVIAVTNEFLSKKTAMKKVYNMTDEEIDEEINNMEMKEESETNDQETINEDDKTI